MDVPPAPLPSSASRVSPPAPLTAAVVGRDVMASLVVLLIALPMSMGVAIAAGVEPAVGLITAIVGGLVVAPLAGSPLQISGPSAGLAVFILQLVATHGIDKLGAIVLIASFLQLVAGSARLGQWFRAVSPAVVSGMLSGVGILIIATQAHVVVDDTPKGTGLQNIVSIPGAVLKAVTLSSESVHHLAALVGVTTLLVLLGWNALRPKALQSVPGPLVAVIVAAVMAAGLDLHIDYIAVPAELTTLLRFPTGQTALLLLDPDVIVAGLALAFVSTAETLLCSTALTRLRPEVKVSYDRELIAQGIGNVICGVLGVLPVTGVISRSSANVEAGARTRIASILLGVWMLAFVALFPSLLALVPTSSLAAILVYVGWRLIDVEAFKNLRTYGRPVLAIFLATTIGVVAVDLLTGIVVGLVMTAMRLIYSLTHLEILVDRRGEGRVDLMLFGSATFVRQAELADALATIPGDVELHIHLEELDFVDHSVLDMLSSWQERHEQGGGRVVVEWNTLLDRYRQGGRRKSGMYAAARDELEAAEAGDWPGDPLKAQVRSER